MCNIIQALITNKMAFGLMSDVMQTKAKGIGHCNFLKYMGPKFLGDTWHNGGITGFAQNDTYRLRRNYKERQPETELEYIWRHKAEQEKSHESAMLDFGDKIKKLEDLLREETAASGGDYKEKPETVECTIFVIPAGLNGPDDKGNLMYSKKGGTTPFMFAHEAVDHPGFVGFKYSDDEVSPLIRLYKKRDGVYCTHLQASDLNAYYEVLTPTHVIFRNK